MVLDLKLGQLLPPQGAVNQKPQPARRDALGTPYPSVDRWIPAPRVLHPYHDARFYSTHPS